MLLPIGFWSYVHADDDGDHGRIVQLAHDIVAEMGLIAGEDIELFLDRDAIQWGNRWRTVIDEGLSKVAFFIPVLTPRYFDRPECRNELQSFARQATQLGVSQLVMPLLYMDIPAIHEDEPADPLIALVKGFQWEPWTELRLSDRSSAVYRQAVNKLANRLVSANVSAEQAQSLTPLEIEESPLYSEDDSPGFMDLIAASEVALPQWAGTLVLIGGSVEKIGHLMDEATQAISDTDARGAGMAGRLRVSRELAGSLEPPVDTIYDLANTFTTQMHTIDIGTRTLIEALIRETLDGTAELSETCEFFQTIRDFQVNLDDALSGAINMASNLSPIEAMSRDLRPPLRRLRHSLTLLAEAKEVIADWIRLINESSIRCT